jgi:hypothetical protein
MGWVILFEASWSLDSATPLEKRCPFGEGIINNLDLATVAQNV